MSAATEREELQVTDWSLHQTIRITAVAALVFERLDTEEMMAGIERDLEERRGSLIANIDSDVYDETQMKVRHLQMSLVRLTKF